MNVLVRADSGASWYAERAAGAFERPRLNFDLDVDVCVIGGGLAGLTTAREVARRGWSVALLEAGQVAGSASGRNCGFVLPGFGADARRMVERVGIDQARELWRLAEAGVEYVRTTVRDLAMPGVQPVDGWLDVSKTDNGDELLAIATLLGQEFGAAIEGWPTERVRAVLKSEHYFHAIHYPTAFHIDPLNYAHGLAHAALAAGAVIYEQTPALAIDPAGVRKRIATPSGQVRAAHVVLAGDAHLRDLVPGIADTVVPVTGYAAVTAPLGERLREAIAYTGAVSDTRLPNHYYRIVDGDRLMWGGDAGLWPRSPRQAARHFRAAIARTFPQLGKVEIAQAWAGQMGFSVHGMPHVGEVIPGLWLAGAFGAHGLNTSAMAGELIAAAITEQDDRWRLFLPYELVWSGGTVGRFVRHVAVWSRARRENWAADQARRREAARGVQAEMPLAAGPPVQPEAVEPEAAEPEFRHPEPAMEPESVRPDVGQPELAEPALPAVAEPPTAAELDAAAAEYPIAPSSEPEPGPAAPMSVATVASLVPEVESLLHQAAVRAKRGPRRRNKGKRTENRGRSTSPPGRPPV